MSPKLTAKADALENLFGSFETTFLSFQELLTRYAIQYAIALYSTRDTAQSQRIFVDFNVWKLGLGCDISGAGPAANRSD